MQAESSPGTPGVVTVLSAILACALVAGASWVSPLVMTVSVLVLALVTALGWGEALSLPSSSASRGVLSLGAVLIILSGLATGAGKRPHLLAAAAATALLLHLAQQVFRQDGRPRLTETMSMSALGIALLSSGAMLLPLASLAHGPAMVTTVMVGAAAAALADLVGRPALQLWVLPLALVLAAAGAVGTGLALGLRPGHAALLGVTAALLGPPVRWLLAQVPATARARGQVVVGLASVLAAGALPLCAARLVILP